MLPIHTKRDALLSLLAGYGHVAVAFSGGVDSAVVARAACGDNAVAVTAVSPSLASGELEQARELAALIGIRHVVLGTQEFEVNTMKQTIADSLIEKGHQEGRQEGHQEGIEKGALETRRMTLVRQLTKRFGELPSEIRSAIENNREPSKLDEWLDGVVTARSLRNLGIR